MRLLYATILACAAVVATAAYAQAPVKPPAADTKPLASDTVKPGASSDPCAQGSATIGSGNEIVAPNAKKNDQSLSEHLARSGGVICPPHNVDPDIKAPTPDVGHMPVIPPPGTPGGDQSVQPK
jgi:hypothetical protein